MSKKILFLNHADKDTEGVAAKSVRGLRLKYPALSPVRSFFCGANEVTQIDLFDLFDGSLSPIERSRKIQEVSLKCAAVDKIMLGMHGALNDTDNTFAGGGWDKGMAVGPNVGAVGNLLKELLVRRRNYKLALIVCYGARAADYTKDHDGALSERDIKSSFAYKLYADICTHANIIMTARTGAVGISSSTGKSEVETELAIGAELEYMEATGTETAKQTWQAFQNLQALRNPDQKTGARAPGLKLTPSKSEQSVVDDYEALMEKISSLPLSAERSTRIGKHGKFLYQYDRASNQILVIRKYEEGLKAMKLIYRGAR